MRWDGCEVPERAVHLGGDVAGAEPGTGGAAGEGSQAGSEEGPQPAGPAPPRCFHPAGRYYATILDSESKQIPTRKTEHKRL